MRETVTPRQACPRCGYQFDRAAGAFTDRIPKHGDVSLCFRCGLLLVFNADLTARPMTEEELDELDKETQSEILRVLVAIHQIRANLS